MNVGVIAEQLFRPVPGGIGRYVQALIDHLPPAASDGDHVDWIVARHTPVELTTAGLPVAAVRRLAWPGRALTQAWVNLRRPALPNGLLDGLDLIHATSAAVPPTRGRPLVATVHDLAFHRYPDAYPAAGRRYHERSALIVAAEAARILVPSESTARDLATMYGVERGRMALTPLGVELPDPDRAGAARLLARLEVGGPFILSVGTLEPRKNLPRLLEAFADAAPDLPEHALVVVGPAGWGPSLRPPSGAARVRLAGPVGDATLHALYEAADAVAFPSLYEGFGLPVLEAMAHGTPVLTSDCSSLPEVAGDAALLVDPRDVGGIASGLVRVAGDGALRARLVAAGRRRAADFTWPATAAATWAVYREAAK